MSDESAPILPPPLATSSQKQWAVAIHLSALLAFVGCTNVLGPIILWLVKRPESIHLDEVGKRVVNFQLSWMIYFVVAGALIFILSFVLIGFLLIPVVGIAMIFWVVYTILGAIKESSGETYRFPLTIQFFK